MIAVNSFEDCIFQTNVREKNDILFCIIYIYYACVQINSRQFVRRFPGVTMEKQKKIPMLACETGR